MEGGPQRERGHRTQWSGTPRQARQAQDPRVRVRAPGETREGPLLERRREWQRVDLRDRPRRRPHSIDSRRSPNIPTRHRRRARPLDTALSGHDAPPSTLFPRECGRDRRCGFGTDSRRPKSFPPAYLSKTYKLKHIFHVTKHADTTVAGETSTAAAPPRVRRVGLAEPASEDFPAGRGRSRCLPVEPC